MPGSNNNISIFTVATESMSQINWRTYSKVALAPSVDKLKFTRTCGLAK